MANSTPSKLTLKHIIGYGAGDCGGCFGLMMLAGYMSRFMQVNLGVNPALLATILLVWNVWDTVNDPLMGTLMDMAFAKAKPGADKFRPWILRSIPILAVGLISFFAVPPMLGGGFATIAAAFILKIVFELGYTMMNIGMGSLLGNMAVNDNERATLSSARGFGSTFAQFGTGLIIPLVLDKFGTTNQGYLIGACVCCVFMVVLVFIHYAWTEERNKGVAVAEAGAQEEKFGIRDILNIFKSNRAFLALVLHSICICCVQSLGSGAASYMYIDVMHNTAIQAVYSTLSTTLMVIILSSAPILTKKWDLVAIIKVCLIAGAIACGSLTAYVMMVPDFNHMLFVVWYAIGNGLITMSVQMQWGLVAESIDYNEYLTGKRNEGTIYGFFSLSRRIGSTIAGSLSVMLIAAVGFDTEISKAGGEQSLEAINGIKAMVCGFPAIAAIGSFCCFTFIWCINKDVRAKMAAWKAAKAGAAE